jgi:cell division protein FtsN
MLKRFGLQRGGTLMGIIVGLVVGLAAALAVAIYVTKAPINFAHKTQTRTPEQDAQETKKNKDWDPNTPLYGKNPVKAASSAEPSAQVPPQTPSPVAPAATAPTKEAAPVAAPAAQPATPAAKSKDPLGDLAKAKTQPAASGDPFVYFVQSGAYRTQADADAQRAKLAMLSFDAKITEREQSGYTVFRVRVGPLDRKEEADRIKEKLESSGIESVLVRVNR